MRKAAYGHGSAHRFPAHTLRELGNDHLQRNAVQIACLSGIHTRILQACVYNSVPCSPNSLLMTTPIRLSKRLIELISCSRREAELYITGGWVTVDGKVVEAPQFMVEDQLVELRPDANATPIPSVTFLLHQPPGDDAEAAQQRLRPDTQVPDDPSEITPLKQHFLGLTQYLPLERNASGLVVFTQDWHIARKLKDDANTIEQEYVVEVTGEQSPDGLKLLNHGLTYNGKALAPAKVSWQNETRLRFAIKGVQAGQIAHACEKVGLQVVSMRRLRIGRIAMSRMPVGGWRYLMPHEKF